MHPVLQDPRVTDWAWPVGFAHFGSTESKAQLLWGQRRGSECYQSAYIHIHTLLRKELLHHKCKKYSKHHFKNTLQMKYKHRKLQQLVLQWHYVLFFLTSKEQMLSKSLWKKQTSKTPTNQTTRNFPSGKSLPPYFLLCSELPLSQRQLLSGTTIGCCIFETVTIHPRKEYFILKQCCLTKYRSYNSKCL